MEAPQEHPIVARAKRYDPNGYVNTQELAERTLTGPSSWAKRRMAGTGPAFIKIGRSVRYRWGDVITWLEDQLRSSTSEY